MAGSDFVNQVDALGLDVAAPQKTLVLSFGFDKTTSKRAMRNAAGRAVADLKDRLATCAMACEFGDPPNVVDVYDDKNKDKPAPPKTFLPFFPVEGGVNGETVPAYRLNESDELLTSNMRKITTTPRGIPVLLTTAALPIGTFGRANGWTHHGVPTIVTRISAPERVLAHELGHVANYVGPVDGTHSDDPRNLMFSPAGEPIVDSQWCAKVSALAM